MTSGSAIKRSQDRQEALAEIKAQQDKAVRKRRLLTRVLSLIAVLAIGGLVTAALLSSRSHEDTATRVAPDFTLTDSDGGTHTLSSLRGKPVLLYFSEGAGCDACIIQQAKIEEDPGFAAAGITELPIVMNTADQINTDRQRIGGKQAYLLDDGTVSKEYGVLGTGMHAGLPGHGFVLVNADGNQIWKGDYPSMWIEPSQLLNIVKGKLGA